MFRLTMHATSPTYALQVEQKGGVTLAGPMSWSNLGSGCLASASTQQCLDEVCLGQNISIVPTLTYLLQMSEQYSADARGNSKLWNYTELQTVGFLGCSLSIYQPPSYDCSDHLFFRAIVPVS